MSKVHYELDGIDVNLFVSDNTTSALRLQRLQAFCTFTTPFGDTKTSWVWADEPLELIQRSRRVLKRIFRKH